MVSIQLDERTAKAIEVAARVAGLSISDFVNSLISSKANMSSKGPWEAVEREFVELSVHANSAGGFLGRISTPITTESFYRIQILVGASIVVLALDRTSSPQREGDATFASERPEFMGSIVRLLSLTILRQFGVEIRSSRRHQQPALHGTRSKR